MNKEQKRRREDRLDGFIKISDVKLNKKYIKCLDCKGLSFNTDDNVCLCCGSKETLRLQ